MTKVAINGFGRIGRLVFRGLLDRTDLDIVAINNPSGPETAAYLLKYDTVHGRLNKKVEIDKDDLIVDGKRIHVFQDRNPENLDWSAYGTEIVIESTGKLKDRESAGKHIRGTVKKVIITAPGKDEDATIVVGVNENIYDPAKDDIISNASCTTNCLAPLAKVINDNFGIVEGLMTTVHSITATQKTVDGVKTNYYGSMSIVGVALKGSISIVGVTRKIEYMIITSGRELFCRLFFNHIKV